MPQGSSFPRQLALAGTRLFFTADDGTTGRELWTGRAATLADRPVQAVQDLKDEVRSLHLARGTETSLLAMLDAAGQAISGHRSTPAILTLEAFGRHLEALAPNGISESAAAELQGFAGDIVTLLEEGSSAPRVPGEF